MSSTINSVQRRIKNKCLSFFFSFLRKAKLLASYFAKPPPRLQTKKAVRNPLLDQMGEPRSKIEDHNACLHSLYCHLCDSIAMHHLNEVIALLNKLKNETTTLNRLNGSGDSILHTAILGIAMWSDSAIMVEITKQIIATPGVDINLQARSTGNSPLYMCAEYGIEEIAELLLQNHAVDPNQSNCLKQTPLHLAVQKRNLPICKLLLERKDISINELTVNGDSPLNYAVRLPSHSNKSEIIDLLLTKREIDITANVLRDAVLQCHHSAQNEELNQNDASVLRKLVIRSKINHDEKLNRASHVAETLEKESLRKQLLSILEV